MELPADSEKDLAALRADLAALKNDVANLVEHIKVGVKSSAQDAVDQVRGGVRGVSRTAADQGQQSAKAVGDWVDQQPMLAVLIAVGVGYFGLRALLR